MITYLRQQLRAMACWIIQGINYLILAAGLGLGGGAMASPAPPAPEMVPGVLPGVLMDKVVAAVAGEPILLSEIKQKLAMGPVVLVDTYPATAASSLYEQALHDAINFAVIKAHAEQLELAVTAAEVQTQLETILAAQRATRDDLRIYLRTQGITLAQYEADLKKQILVQKFQARVIAPNTRLGDELVRESYQKQFGTSPYDEKIAFVQVQVVAAGRSDTQLQGMAMELYQLIQTREDGVQQLLNQELGEWQERITLSAPRQVALSELTDHIITALPDASPPAVSPPVKIGAHWSLLVVTKREPTLKQHFLTKKTGLIQQLRLAKMAHSLRGWLAQERSTQQIFVSDFRPQDT